MFWISQNSIQQHICLRVGLLSTPLGQMSIQFQIHVDRCVFFQCCNWGFAVVNFLILIFTNRKCHHHHRKTLSYAFNESGMDRQWTGHFPNVEHTFLCIVSEICVSVLFYIIMIVCCASCAWNYDILLVLISIEKRSHITESDFASVLLTSSKRNRYVKKFQPHQIPFELFCTANASEISVFHAKDLCAVILVKKWNAFHLLKALCRFDVLLHFKNYHSSKCQHIIMTLRSDYYICSSWNGYHLMEWDKWQNVYSQLFPYMV